MKGLMIPAFAAVALFAAATAMLWSPSTKLSAGTAAMPSLHELHTVESDPTPRDDQVQAATILAIRMAAKLPESS